MEHSAKEQARNATACSAVTILPKLTVAGVVDMVITDLGVFTCIDRKNGSGMTLVELAPKVTARRDQGRRRTASFKVANTLTH